MLQHGTDSRPRGGSARSRTAGLEVPAGRAPRRACGRPAAGGAALPQGPAISPENWALGTFGLNTVTLASNLASCSSTEGQLNPRQRHLAAADGRTQARLPKKAAKDTPAIRQYTVTLGLPESQQREADAGYKHI